MGHFGTHWRIGGVAAAFVMKGARNGQYQVLFERENASLEQIEAIDWARPAIEKLTDRDGEAGLPEGYGFEVVGITYDSGIRSYTVTVQTARQYLGDVTGYQAQAEALEVRAAAAEEQAAAAKQAAADRERQLAAAYEEGVERNG